MPNIGPLEIAIVVVVVLLLFGAKRLPEMGSGLGRGIREFKEGITGEDRRQPLEQGEEPDSNDGVDANAHRGEPSPK
jgi:sec-independent protein translocase protein TatA